MSYVERKTSYFETKGKQNTKILLERVKEYADKTGVRDVVVASTTGETGVAASKLFHNLSLVVVTHHSGFSTPGAQNWKRGIVNRS